MSKAKHRAARRPAPRTVHVAITEGDFAGWEATARADFSARLLTELDSGKIDHVWAVLDVIVLEHNFPNSEGDVAEKMGDVDPYDGLVAVADAIFEAIGKLPKR